MLVYWIHVQIVYCFVNYGVMLLLGVESLMAGSITGVPMSPGYGGNQSTSHHIASYYSTSTNAAPA
jgi:hypothetical protein